MKRWWVPWTVAMGLGLAVGGFKYLVDATSKHPPSAIAVETPSNDEVLRLRREVQALRGDLRSVALGVQVAIKPQPTADAAPSPAVDAVEPPTEAEQAQRSQRYLEQVSVAFKNEPRDRSWSSLATTAIQAHLADEDVKLTGVSVDCRSETCRVEIPNVGSGDVGKGLPMLIHRLGPTLPNTVAEQGKSADGNPSTVIYMSRGAAPPEAP